jgi:hypothetical protein
VKTITTDEADSGSPSGFSTTGDTSAAPGLTIEKSVARIPPPSRIRANSRQPGDGACPSGNRMGSSGMHRKYGAYPQHASHAANGANGSGPATASATA